MLILSEQDIAGMAKITNILVNKVLSYINATFLNVFPTDIKWVLALTIFSVIVFSFTLFICMIIGIICHFLIAVFNKNNEKSAYVKFKDVISFLLNKIRDPKYNLDTPLTRVLHTVLPVGAFLVYFLRGWKIMLPIFLFWIFSTKYVSEKLHYKISLLLFIFLIIMMLSYLFVVLNPELVAQ